ncbi:Flagellar basal-body rod modification protein FlgD [Rhodovulum sp. P5]|uniref:flagellar hook capping FlgD N-terminal domain-containing protein n=1 Tax=Rhodovulum sp. P5 TaxID=1564506 RepID=UPI0009C23B2C|nr:flagellar hook capping FlgD N-terminal domain-containing protein [Rhodovulum sp. P5]ARE40386.1 Flagellar basal-body rod modification protein FlgD [Rhodovulum sp. P5]
MDSVSTTTASTTTSTSTTSTTQSSDDSSALSSDFQTFLTMLTVQLQNQDPLNPMESQEFAVQLATFSGVEQQVKSNELLENLNENLGGAGLAQYGGWVGMEGRAAVAAYFDGSPISVVPEIDSAADSAQMVVRDENNREISRFDISIDGEPVVWDGTNTAGTTADAGSYTFVVESYADDAHISEAQGEVFAEITEVRSDSDGIVIVFSGGDEASASDISALRQPEV